MAAPWEKYAGAQPPADSAPPWERYAQASQQPQQPQEPAWDPTSEMSNFDKVAAGVGKSIVDTGRGLKQLGAAALDVVNPREQTLSTLVTGQKSRQDELRAQYDEQERLDAPLMNTGGGMTGYVLGTAGQMLLPGAAASRAATLAKAPRLAAGIEAAVNPTTYKAAVASGAAQGFIRPVGEDDSRLANTAVGGLAGAGGQLISNTAQRIAQPVKNVLDAGGKRAVKILEAAGVPLDTAQRTGSKAVGKIKQGLSGNPYTAGGQEAFQETQNKAFMSAALKTIGVNADNASEDVLGAARDRIGGVFNTVLDKYDIPVAGAVENRLKAIAARSTRLLPGDNNQITRQVQYVLDNASQNGGKINGRFYQAVKGELDDLSLQRDVSPLAREMKDELENALQGVAKGKDYDDLLQARQQYGRLLKIADATDESGRFSPAKLFQQFNTKRNRSQAKFGKGDVDLIRLAKAGKQVLTDKTPNSGTAARAAAAVAVPAAAYVAGQAATGDPVEAAKWAGVTVVAPKVLQALINNPSLANKMSNGTKNKLLRELLESPQWNAAVRSAPLGTAAAVEAQE